VHRDVKPGNILVTHEGRAVLTDFGIATLNGDPGLTQAGMVMGTPGFCAPERIRGEPASPASDLWSLGATLYAAVEGRGPFEGQGSAMAVLANIVHGDPPPAKSAGPLGPVITALMKRDPAARPDAITARRLFAAACAGYDEGASSRAQSVSGAQADSDTRSASGGQSAPDVLSAPGVLSASGPQAGSGVPAVSGAGALAGAESERPAGAGTVPGETGAPGAAGLGGTLAFPASPPQGIAAFAGQPPTAEELPPPVTAAEPAPAGVGIAGAEFAATVAAQPSMGMTAATAPVAARPGRVPGPGGVPGAGGVPGPGVMPGPMPGGRRRPGRHRRALLFGGGGTAVVLAALIVTLGHAHAARLQEIRRTAASSPIKPSGPLPAGYHWYTAQGSSSPRRAGFSIAVPNGWRTRQHGDTTLMRDPATHATITVTRGAQGGPGPLREAALLASAPHKSFPGYHQIALLPVPFHGTLAGAWRFTYARPGVGNEQVLELVARMNTSLGAQPYELTLTSPRRAWPASRAAFDEAMNAFTPQS